MVKPRKNCLYRSMMSTCSISRHQFFAAVFYLADECQTTDFSHLHFYARHFTQEELNTFFRWSSHNSMTGFQFVERDSLTIQPRRVRGTCAFGLSLRCNYSNEVIFHLVIRNFIRRFGSRLIAVEAPPPNDFQDHEMNGRLPRALIVAHYDRDGLIDPHVLYSLREYRAAFEHITVVSVSADRLPPGQEFLADTFIRRENVGYDYFSWKIGFNALAEKEKFFEVVFVNDSIYGPLFDIKHALLSPRIINADFWGLTNSSQIQWHTQSYFFSMRSPLLRSNAAQDYWDSVQPLKHKVDVINNYELKMAKYFRSRGWLTGAIYMNPPRTRWKTVLSGVDLRYPRRSARYLYYNWRSKEQNPMHYLWRTVIDEGVPFVKVEAIRDNPERLPSLPILNYIAQSTRYPVNLISAHLRRYGRDIDIEKYPASRPG